jgi:hypothetical protein
MRCFSYYPQALGFLLSMFFCMYFWCICACVYVCNVCTNADEDNTCNITGAVGSYAKVSTHTYMNAHTHVGSYAKVSTHTRTYMNAHTHVGSYAKVGTRPVLPCVRNPSSIGLHIPLCSNVFFFQIIWDKTTSVGCSMSECATGASIWVCKYGYDISAGMFQGLRTAGQYKTYASHHWSRTKHRPYMAHTRTRMLHIIGQEQSIVLTWLTLALVCFTSLVKNKASSLHGSHSHSYASHHWSRTKHLPYMAHTRTCRLLLTPHIVDKLMHHMPGTNTSGTNTSHCG